jgi:malate dehydrogenase (oxaloacetate-decarboxylating)(NADP+)
VSFGFIRLLPGDPVVLMAGERSLTPERHAELLKQFGFDRPVWEQYMHYVWDLLHGDLGVSLKTKMPVLQEFLTLFPATVELSLAAMLFAVLLGIPAGELQIMNARVSDQKDVYTEFLYGRLQRQGYLQRDAQRMINQDRNVFGATMVALGHADGMVTGVTRNYATSLSDILQAIDPRKDVRPIGLSIIIGKTGPIMIADTSVTEMPGAQELAEIAISAATAAHKLGFTPRVAFLSYSTFGNPPGERMAKVRDAVALLDAKGDVGFEYDGEMAVDVALNPDARRLYPFCRLTGAANVLVMPAIHSAAISTKIAATLGGVTVLGPLLVGLKSSVQIAQLDATAQDIVNLAAFAAYNPNG